MSINRRSLQQREFNNILMRTCPRKLMLIHALPYNCTGGSCFNNGRGSISALCLVCDGTGYLTGTQAGGNAQKPPFSQPPYANSCMIYGDLQIGHGLYGSGGDLIRLIGDLGKESIGDATLFSKVWDVNHANGEIVYPIIDPILPRPDVIISTYGKPYNVIKELIVEIGNEQICRVFTLENGSFGLTSGR